VAHVELSVSEPFVPPQARDFQPELTGSLKRWGATAAQATEACLVIDSLFTIVAASASACALLGFACPDAALHRSLFAGVLQLLDFTSPGAALTDGDLEKIPPVLACSSGRLARGLLRVRSADEVLTIDAIATPLFDGTSAVGSLTFFSEI
jgi:hypothetical protein